MSILSFEELSPRLGASVSAWTRLMNYLRTHYVMDEVFDGKDELKFRRSGKTLVTLYLHEGYFAVMLIFGRKEREAFEAQREAFPQAVREIYDASRTYHDGKWMLFNVCDESLIEPLTRLLTIKKKPNRKPENREGMILSVCGNRCDQCLLYHRNSGNGGNLRFQEGDARCYRRSDEPAPDYSGMHCPGCREDCAVSRCARSKGYASCIECDYEQCGTRESNFTEPGNISVGVSAEDIELFVLPYCGRERFDDMKRRGEAP
ncbi:MAG: DUF3788 family protein [Christensenellaceae bacterium]|nr:DUF3788 family protein [Christensenellaceae bacterium]